jgi:hypothetical protein
MDGDAAVLGLLRGDVVDRVGVEIVLYEVSLAVVEADGPEPVDRYVFDGECIRRFAIVLLRYEYFVPKIFLCRIL